MSIEEKNNLKRAIEGILFVSGEPVGLKKLSKLLEQKEDDIREMILEMREEFNDRGLIIISDDEKYQLTTSPNISNIITEFLKTELKDDLSPASLETLAIIAYKGPISRIEIDNIRGVNSSFILRSLLVRGLITKEKSPNSKLINVYRISFDMIRNLGIENIHQLPDFDKYQ